MAQGLKVLMALAETQVRLQFTIICGFRYRRFDTLFWPLKALYVHGAHVHMLANTHTGEMKTKRYIRKKNRCI